jgi:hypothetical protein
MANSEMAICELQRSLDPERLAYWYFRLNGFLTTVNFVVHSEEGMAVRTDVDVLGVRFPHRAELLTNPMPDDARFGGKTKPYVVIAEVKKDRCGLNGPWTRHADRNLQRVLAAMGAIPPEAWDHAAQALYDVGVYEDQNLYLTLCCLGRIENPEYIRQFPRVPQILWVDIAGFIYRRVRAYLDQKRANQQWDSTGRLLYQLARDAQDEGAFTQKVLDAIATYEQRTAI